LSDVSSHGEDWLSWTLFTSVKILRPRLSVYATPATAGPAGTSNFRFQRYLYAKTIRLRALARQAQMDTAAVG
jgi:hypothetical protein